MRNATKNLALAIGLGVVAAGGVILDRHADGRNAALRTMEAPQSAERVQTAMNHYRLTLQNCVEHPGIDTAQALNEASREAHSAYSDFKKNTPGQPLDLDAELAQLRKKAVSAVNQISPRTPEIEGILRAIDARSDMQPLAK